MKKPFFEPTLEAQFRQAFLQRLLPRARLATAIYLVLVFVVATLTSALTSVPETAVKSIRIALLAVACPALTLLLLTAGTSVLERHYQAVAGVAAVVLGVGVMTAGNIAAAAGSPELQMAGVLLIAYCGLFLGLLYRVAVAVVAALLASFVAIGVLLGLPAGALGFTGAMLAATALMTLSSAARVEQLMRANFIETRLLSEIAERDGLTGLYNRRGFDNLAEKLWHQAYRDQQHLQILIVDIDYFKQFNDLYGHQAGDECIKRISRAIERVARRPLDLCARYGGEEFVLALYGAAHVNPEALAEQCRREVLAESIRHEGSDIADVVSVSVGSVTAASTPGRRLPHLIRRADEALYRAKQTGRNRAVHSDLGPADLLTGEFKVSAVG